jgi:catechol 2,3-dioxygenase-like lactoylglutathione lyase family enzyme
MINAVHVLLYSTDADADRAFLRDVLQWPYVEDGASGGGWLIFKLPPAELGVHPTTETPTASLHLMSDDIGATVRDLESRGVTFDAPVASMGWGVGTTLTLPGGATVGLYEPRHAVAFTLDGGAS